MTVREKVKRILDHLDMMQNRDYHLIQENYSTIKEIRQLIKTLFSKETS